MLRMEVIHYNLPILIHSYIAHLRRPKTSLTITHKRLLSKYSFRLLTDGGCWGYSP